MLHGNRIVNTEAIPDLLVINMCRPLEKTVQKKPS